MKRQGREDTGKEKEITTKDAKERKKNVTLRKCRGKKTGKLPKLFLIQIGSHTQRRKMDELNEERRKTSSA